MGLDQYVYAAMKAEQQSDYYNSSEWDPDLKEYVSTTVAKPREIAYWRKHPNLHGWMQNLWLKKLNIPKHSTDQFIENKIPGDFNGVELELTWDDIDQLEKDIKTGKVAQLGTTGFFFGKPSDYYYREKDLQFCKDAKAELFLKFRIFYNSSW